MMSMRTGPFGPAAAMTKEIVVEYRPGFDDQPAPAAPPEVRLAFLPARAGGIVPRTPIAQRLRDRIGS